MSHSQNKTWKCSCLKYTKCALVSHAHQTAQRELQDHGAFERDKVPHVLQQEVLGSVVVTITTKAVKKN